MTSTKQVKCGVLVSSDRSYRGESEDRSGPALKTLLAEEIPNSTVMEVVVVPDEADMISDALRKLCDEDRCDLVITSGGTGFAPRDVTPEATKAVLDKECSGLVTGMLVASLKITPMTMLSRPAAGIRGSTLIINMPGSPKAVKELFEAVKVVIPHGVKLLGGSDDPHPTHKK